MSAQTVTTEIAGGVMTLTLNRPERLNAFSRAMLDELLAVLDRADADDAVRAVIVTGAGRAFCAGVDLDTPDAFTSARIAPATRDPGVWDAEGNRDMGGILALRLYNCLKPVIAAVNGPAVGIGATMQLPMDIRLASEAARFGFVFTRRGIVPEAASSWFLPRLVGMGQALEWCYTGRVFDADEALRGGLVRSVHPPGALLDAAHALAREIAGAAAPVSVALTRQMMWRMAGAAHPMQAHRIDSRAIVARANAGDVAEGVASFRERRAPAFPDRVSRDMPGFFPWWQEPGWHEDDGP